MSGPACGPFGQLYTAFGVAPDYDGPLAAEYHALIARMYLKGMRGGHTSIAYGAQPADIVRSHLAIQWAMDRGLCSTVRNLDGPFDWDRVLDILDRWRVGVKRRFHRNPYSEPRP